MKQLKIEYDDNSATYHGSIRDDDGCIESAVTCCATMQDFKIWCHEHNVTREEWLAAKINY